MQPIKKTNVVFSLLLLLTFLSCFAFPQEQIPDYESTKPTEGAPYEDLNPFGTTYNLLGTELIVNGGFETGNFSGWTVSPFGSQGWYYWQVTPVNGGDGVTGVVQRSSPFSGAYSAWNGFCCNSTVNPEYIYQDVTIPPSQNAVLKWSERIQSDLQTFCSPPSCGSNTFRVQILNPATSAVLQTLLTVTAPGGTVTNTGWVTHTANLSAYAGQTIRIRFATQYASSISGHYNGPGRAEIDGVSLVTTPGVVYMRSSAGAPWGQSTNEAAMNAVFGAGNWHDLRYETAIAADVFNSNIDLVFMEGGDFTANEMETFLNANQALIEAWVAAGGRLFLNAAPNEGNGMSYGFGSTQLVYPNFSGAGTALIAPGQSGHPIFNTPFTPVGSTWNGSSFNHSTISCPVGCASLIVSATGFPVLSSKQHGAGLVLFGGMTTTNFHSPQPQATNLRRNILYFLYNTSLSLNTAPTAVGDSYTTDEDTPLPVAAPGVLTNDTDAQADPMTAIIVSSPANAQSFTLNSNGSFSYSPNPDYCGSDSFTYKANDGQADSNIVTVQLTVTCVNDPPTLAAVPASATIDELAPYGFTATASDIENSPLVFSLSGAPAGAAIDPGTGSFSWTPTEAQGPGNYVFNVNVSDGTATTSLPINITVNEVNAAPQISSVPASATIDELAPYAFTATVSDSDVPVQTLTFSLVGAPAGASINPGTGAFSWTPTETQGPGVYSFGVRVSDGLVNADAAISLTVNEVNAAPQIANVPASPTIDELAPYGFTATASDSDVPVQALAFSLVGAPAGASIDPGSGAFSWTPTEAQGPGVYSFGVRVSDGVVNTDAAISITVNEVNLAPQIADVPASATIDENVHYSFTASATDSDVPTQELTFSLVGHPAGSSINPNTGQFGWKPNEFQGPGVHTFTVRVSDGVTNTDVEITLTVNEVNSAPAMNAIANQTVDEETVLGVAAAATDADNPANVLTYSLDAAPTGMSIDSTTGAISWTPTEAEGPGDYPVTVRVTDDGSPSMFGTTSFSVHVNEVNVAPDLASVSNATIDEQTPLSFDASATDSDLPANGLTFSLSGAPAGASITAGGAFSWTPSEAQGPGVYTFSVKVTDDGSPALSDEQEVTITVNEVNLAPDLGAISNQTGYWGNAFGFNATATDPDIPANTLTFSLIGAPAGAAINPTSGVFGWTPGSGQIGSHTFVVRVTDNGSPSLYDEQSVTINVGQRPTALVYTGDGSEQYSDQQALSALLVDAGGGALNGTPIVGRNVGFAIGSQNTSGVTNGSGVASANLILTQDPAPAYSVASAFAGDALYLPASDSDPFDILQEDARGYYTGTVFVNTSCATCSGATATLSATIKDITAEPADPSYDGFAGDISNASVTFVNRDTNTAVPGCANLPVGLVSLSDQTVGTATCNWNVNIGAADSLDSTIGIVINRYYSRNDSGENTVLTISKPIGTNFITGGGYLINALSNGQYAGLTGLRTNFGFNVKYNNSGKNLQGNVNVIVRGAGGRVYQIKGNVMRTLSVRTVSNNPLVRAAVYTGKANVTDITDPLNPIALGGNNTFQMELTDNGEPGSTDTMGITAWNDAGGVLFSSRWNGTRTVEQILGGGNLVVR